MFLRSQRSDRQGMYVTAHAAPQRFVDHLMTLQWPFAGKILRHNNRFKMRVVIAGNLYAASGYTVGNKLFNVAGCHDQKKIPSRLAAYCRDKSTVSLRASRYHANDMLINLLYTLAGFVMLIWGADRFSAGAGAVARLLGVPPVVIGLTVVAFATSAPEVMVSISAARDGLTGMAVGNALGSNIANIGLVLGASAVLRPISHEISVTLRSELPVLFAVSIGAGALLLDGSLDFMDGIILLIALALFLYWVSRTGQRLQPGDPVIAEAVQELPPSMAPWRAGGALLIGFAVLLIGAELLVDGAESLARAFGVSDLVIGLTVIAVGTSLPELAVSVVSALRGEAGIAIGNVIGSNVFNLLAVIGAAGIAGPGELDTSVIRQHYPVMLLFTVALLRLTYNPFGKPGIGRAMGLILLAGFVLYQIWLLSDAL